MATFTEGNNDGTLNGTTPVTIVAAPAASTRRLVRTITVYNADTAAVTVTLRYVSAGGTRLLSKTTLPVGMTLVWGSTLVLDATTDSITSVMSGAAATTNPDFTSHYADVTG